MAWKRDLMMMLMTGMAAAAGQDPLPSHQGHSSAPVLIVRLCDVVGMESGVYSEFKDQAAAILRNGGIESIWVHCTASEIPGKPAQCSAPLRATEVILLLTPDAPKHGAQWTSGVTQNRPMGDV
jgi:hypothetical protein